jgi:hypothetical protein
MSVNPLTVITIIGLVIAGLQTFGPKIKLAPSDSDLNASLRPQSYSQKGGRKRKYKTKKNRRK